MFYKCISSEICGKTRKYHTSFLGAQFKTPMPACPFELTGNKNIIIHSSNACTNSCSVDYTNYHSVQMGFACA